MKRSRFTEDQIIGILEEHGEAWQRHWPDRHAERDFRRRSVLQARGQRCDRLQWKAKYGGMDVSEGRQCCAIGPSDNGYLFDPTV